MRRRLKVKRRLEREGREISEPHFEPETGDMIGEGSDAEPYISDSGEETSDSEGKAELLEIVPRLKDLFIEKEIHDRCTSPMSTSSQNSAKAPTRLNNPLVKAGEAQRKDQDFVANLRKEVIHLVEPFRATALSMDGRVKALE
jgi:hypothetical protein